MYEELVKRLREWPRVCVQYDGSIDQLHDDAADAIEELSREVDIDNDAMTAMDAAMPRWIPVTERLPEKNGKYLCYVKRFGQYAGMQYYYVDVLVFQEDCFFEDGIGTERVTHWMPLPPPPKEET